MLVGPAGKGHVMGDGSPHRGSSWLKMVTIPNFTFRFISPAVTVFSVVRVTEVTAHAETSTTITYLMFQQLPQ